MHDFLYLNGQILAKQAAKISPFDHGFTVGDGVFESLVTYAGKAFAVRRHWERLVQSAIVMDIVPPTLETFAEAISQLIQVNQLDHARLRITLTGGEAPLGSEKGSGAATLLMASMDVPQRPPLAKVVTVPWTRNETGALFQVKSTSYGENVVALAAAKKQGGQEALFANTKGELCEGTGSNLFLVLADKLHTPPLSSGCLAGITRALVIELAQELGITVSETPLPLTALHQATEAFLTSTYREVQAISQVDDHRLPEAPGAISQQLASAFRRKVTHEGWLGE